MISSKLLNYFKQNAIAFDQLFNTLAGGFSDETLSARAWRLRNTNRFWAIMRLMIDGLFFWQKAHCRDSYLSEKNRKHLPIEYR